MEKESLNVHVFTINNKEVTVYPCAVSDGPIIYLNTFAEQGDQVYKALQSVGCPNCTLVAISELNWEHDMAPWDIPPLSKGGSPCTGGADEYLQLLIGEIVPEAEKWVHGSAVWRGMAGYSLAGLFAIYSMYQTTVFSRIASMSGSLWFPGFKEYVFSHEIKGRPDCLYFSLGDRECKTRNPYLKTVQENTEEIEAFYRRMGINTALQMNPGGHFKGAVDRTAAGIAWLLSR